MRKLALGLVYLLVAGTAQSQTATAAKACVSGLELTNPYEFRAEDGVLKMDLYVGNNDQQVPIDTGSGCHFSDVLSLRNYGFVKPGDTDVTYGFPGPTLRLRKGDSPGKPGDALLITLKNRLPVMGADQCNALCPKPCASGSTIPCCQDKATLPNCFHGENTTNLHFHGTHVSPQKPQDWVLLELQPAGSSESTHEHGSHGPLSEIHAGDFPYKVNALPWNQPPGTQWYHPHKHGSTAIQVGNGMAGALIIEGELDDQLNALFPKKPAEKIMVVQQVHDLNFNSPNPVLVPIPLINGYYRPHVTMYKGEVQRWRIISATTDASAQMTVNFSDVGAEVAQIAMDGVQFAPENYKSQPFTTNPTRNFNLSPGNRADFLVQAPAETGRYTLTYKPFGAIGVQGERTAPGAGRRVKQRAESRRNLEEVSASEPIPLLTIVVVDSCGADCPAMTLPATFPTMPSYLSDIDKVDGSRTVQFFIDQPPTQPAIFPQKLGVILDSTDPSKLQQFNGDCAAITVPLGRREEWTLSQNIDSPLDQPFHVFHMHTNHFQILNDGKKSFTAPYPWMDSITLPDHGSTAVIRNRWLDYTGQFVLHCHFLGHEDRGMMLSVQTVCPDNLKKYGKADPNGGPDDCGIQWDAIPQCPPPTTATRVRMKKK
jgi:FtsP/CotA-like multicopper oxidase with cupredoxin domain